MAEESRNITMDELQSMMSKASKEAVTASLSDFENKLKTVYTVDNGPAKTAEIVPAQKTAVMADSDFTKLEFMGIPIGQAAIGGFVAVAATELVDGFLAKQNVYLRGGTKLVAAFAAARYLKKIKFIGDGGAKAVALLITFDAIRDLIPIDVYAQKMVSKVTGKTMTAGLAGNNKAMKEILKPKSDEYYTLAMGGRN